MSNDESEGHYPSPSSTSSLASSILPTPSHPYTSRHNSLPDAYPPYTTPVNPLSPPLTGKEQVQGMNTFKLPLAPIHSNNVPEMTISVPSPIETKHHGLYNPPKRSATHPNPRAPPPPPILVRRPTDVRGRNDQVSLDSVPSPSKSPTRGYHFGGLNISGLEQPSSSIDREHESEEIDNLPDLLQTPHRAFFSNASTDGAPSSPAWQSINPSPKIGQSPNNGSPLSARRRSSEVGATIPFSPLGPAPRSRFDPTPQHGIHARNLSLYFPQPGKDPLDGSISPTIVQQGQVLPAGDITKERNVFGGSTDWSFGQPADKSFNPEKLDPLTADTKRGKRRGHHHKHSLSHNFFSFLDPTQTNPDLASSSTSQSHTPLRADTPQKVPMLQSAAVISADDSTLSPLPPSKKSPRHQMLGSFASLEFLIGAGLWIEGQMSGWRCLAGLGYLVVFDAMGVAVTMLVRDEAWNTIRRPYGSARFLSLMYFAQSLFLVFSAVYIAKEALEQVVLGSGAHEHGGGGHGHGEHIIEADERPFPRLLLISAFLASAFSGSVLDNHRKLAEAVGPLFLPPKLASSRLASNVASVLSNPFSLTVAGMSLAVLLGSLAVPLTSLTSLDSALSLLLTVLTAALSYPPTLAFGHVLLQTAPPPSAPQMKQLKKVIKDVNADQRVLGVGTVRCWSVGATTPQEEVVSGSWWSLTPSNSSPNSPRLSSFGDSPVHSPTRNGFPKSDHGSTPLVVSLTVHVHPDVSDRDMLEVSKYAWVKVNGAVGTKRKGLSQGEVSVGVKRGWDGVVE